MLEVSNLNIFYGKTQVIYDLSLRIEKGEVVSLLGPNGAGKTTVFKAISGLIRPRSGGIKFLGKEIGSLPAHQVAKLGLIYVPEEIRIFPRLTIRENLEVGAYRAREKMASSFSFVYEIFPLLQEREQELAGNLSGGQQRMLVLAKGIISQPLFLLLDDPFLGLSPKLVSVFFKIIAKLKKRGVTILLVGQHVKRILAVVDRSYIIESGRITLKGKGIEILEDSSFHERLLGIKGTNLK